MEMWVTCDSCEMKSFFGVRLDKPVPDEELRARVIDKLGPGGAYICPRCGSLVFVYVGGKPVADAARLQRAEEARRIGQATKGIRFAVGEPGGARSSVWRVWMNDRRDDVYIAARSLASEVKVSLHPDFWYYGFTSTHAARASSLVPPGADRKKFVWDRPDEFGSRVDTYLQHHRACLGGGRSADPVYRKRSPVVPATRGGRGGPLHCAAVEAGRCPRQAWLPQRRWLCRGNRVCDPSRDDNR